ncbi:hypothetical protein PIB30_012228 [Stylosanthes scabra]|uniref:Uncharacterized protein n=1 Tax=Stylosanthes scabra TaxID=79078 RepID=A0ABU6V589_9FABA|nr:hypothetical protein [Stylosanthes scabra]
MGAFASAVIYMRDAFSKMVFFMIALLAPFALKALHASTWMAPNALAPPNQQRQKQPATTLAKQGQLPKSGIDPSNCVDLAKHVKLSCPNLVFSGLMTIGRPDYTSTPENLKVFSSVKIQALSNCRFCKALEMAEEQCELSMGMSSDFELAEGILGPTGPD